MAVLNVVQQAVALPAACQGGLQVYAVCLAPAAGSPAALRESLRHAVHQSICSALAEVLQCDARQLSVQRVPGQAPVLSLGGQTHARIHLSVAYAGASALWAWSDRAAVGVDVQAIPADGDDAEWHAVERQFIGPAAQALSPLQGAGLRAAFAAQWAQLEARLKCAGLQLSEADARPADWDANMHCVPLAWPAAWGTAAAALAWHS
ncbi:4'-phosphopantetheinyl transferase [Comamonas odontotermitis]|uniref:4'-phosphopantetheinyl transferase n=1 Tax=Comamonas odontotermitis TaxID=379895 RepID=A0ABR6RBL2_9BURK|nr:hypothetical protein [Comamonas odontotermitis]MBB6576444.1 4'-phosphopantetheinyl transferase [Comamonas odontotermitis]